jgi:hypothetical protein
MDFSARATHLWASQAVFVLTIDEYLAIPNPQPPDWDSAKAGIEFVLTAVKRLWKT